MTCGKGAASVVDQCGQPIGCGFDATRSADWPNRSSSSSVPASGSLAERHSQDVDVVLWWGKRSGRLWVLVTDRYSGRTDRINATAWNALDVFQHPFAYQPEPA